MDTVLAADDEVIAVSADDDTVRLAAEPAAVDESAIRVVEAAAAAPERTLVLGWNRRAPTIIRELDAYVAGGSEVVVVADTPDSADVLEALGPTLANQSVRFVRADTTSRRVLDRLDVPSFDHIVVLCYADTLDAQRADSRTIITLLHLRDMEERNGLDFSIVSEMLDLRNRALAEVTHADDFIVSARLVSLLMAQVAENAHLNAVFADLFDQDGSEIYLRRAGDYVDDWGRGLRSRRSSRRRDGAARSRSATDSWSSRGASADGQGVTHQPAEVRAADARRARRGHRPGGVTSSGRGRSIRVRQQRGRWLASDARLPGRSVRPTLPTSSATAETRNSWPTSPRRPRSSGRCSVAAVKSP